MADTGKVIERLAEPYIVRADGVKIYQYKSPNRMKIIQHPSEQIYDEALDVETATWTYTESDEPIDGGDEPSDVEQKAEAFDYITGRSGNE